MRAFPSGHFAVIAGGTIEGTRMTRSMTAYASRTGSISGLTWVWEMRGVNARGLDVRVRMPDGMAAVETALRAALKPVVTRGNITVSLRLNRDDTAEALSLDTDQLDRVLAALETVQDRAFAMGVTLGQPTAADVLAQRGVIRMGGRGDDDDALIAGLTNDIAPLVADFVQMRETEGEALHDVLTGQLDGIALLVEQAATQADERQTALAQNLKDAVARLLDTTEIDPDRLAQEMAILATKQDVTEEIDRLRAHVDAARNMLKANSPMGRKLDFLAQEFNREANTLCAKSQNAALTAIGLDLKVAVDQMREQVQNVE